MGLKFNQTDLSIDAWHAIKSKVCKFKHSMKKTLGVLFLMLLIILPVGLVIGFSYAGISHPIEHKFVEHDAFLNRSSNDVEILFLALRDVQ